MYRCSEEDCMEEYRFCKGVVDENRLQGVCAASWINGENGGDK